MNGHRFTTTSLDTDLPVAIYTQSHQIPFQECWTVSVIHKLPNSTPDHICCQFETANQLVLQSRHIHSLNINQPPSPTLAPAALTIFVSLFYSILLKKATVFSLKLLLHFLTIKSLWARRRDSSCLGKCHSVPPIIFII